MFWIIAAAVTAVPFGFAWWSSGRARPGRIEHHRPSRDELYQTMRDSQRGSDGVG